MINTHKNPLLTYRKVTTRQEMDLQIIVIMILGVLCHLCIFMTIPTNTGGWLPLKNDSGIIFTFLCKHIRDITPAAHYLTPPKRNLPQPPPPPKKKRN